MASSPTPPPSLRTRIARATATQLWMAALLTSWGAFALFTALDFAGAAWLGIRWAPAPDLYPNPALAAPLAAFQILACALLAGHVARSRTPAHPVRSLLAGLARALATAAGTLVLFILLALLHHTRVMGRPL